MLNAETGSSMAMWLGKEKKVLASPELKGDPLPALEKHNNTYLCASVEDSLSHYFRLTAQEIDDEYVEDKHFQSMVTDLLFLSTLLDALILKSKPVWDKDVLEQFNPPHFEDKNLEFAGYLCGGSGRAVISSPENYAAVAKLYLKFGVMPDMMDIDKKLPLSGESFKSLVQSNLAPFLVELLSGYVKEVLPIEPEQKGIVFRGLMGPAQDGEAPRSLLTIRVIEYVNKTVLEIRLSDICQDLELKKSPDFTLHLSNYEPDLRNGPQMPQSMNSIVPIFASKQAEEGFSETQGGNKISSLEWLILSGPQWTNLQETFKYPEIIKNPQYHTIEEALHAGLRAIAEKTQHLRLYKDFSGPEIPFEELLHGDWWLNYQKKLLSLFHENKTEGSVLGRENEFLTSEIIKLFTRLCDYDARLFLRMAFPMGILEVLEPEFKDLVKVYGQILVGSSFLFADTDVADAAIRLFSLQFPSAKARNVDDHKYVTNNYRIYPDHLGGQVMLKLLDENRILRGGEINGPVKNLRTLLHSTKLEDL